MVRVLGGKFLEVHMNGYRLDLVVKFLEVHTLQYNGQQTDDLDFVNGAVYDRNGKTNTVVTGINQATAVHYPLFGIRQAAEGENQLQAARSGPQG